MLGGFLAVAYTDLLQGLLMVVGVVVLPIAGFLALPGGVTFVEALAAKGPALLSVTGGKAGESLVFGVILSGLAWGIGYPGQPHILARFMAIRDARKIRRAMLIGVVWVVLALYGALFLGILGACLFDVDPAQRDTIMPLMAQRLLPPLLEGVLIAAAVAAMMSTVDSQMLIAVGAIDRDILEKLFGVRLTPRHAVLLARIVVAVLGGLGILIARSQENVFETVFDAWGGLGAGLGPAVLLTVLWKGTHRTGVICGMACGVVLVQAWAALEPVLFGHGAAAPLIPPLVPGFVLNVAVTVGVSAAVGRR
jgi:sodium/proline symporter